MSEIIEQDDETESWRESLVLLAKDLVKDIWDVNRDGEDFPCQESMTELERENYIESITQIYDGLVRGTVWCVLVGQEGKRGDCEII